MRGNVLSMSGGGGFGNFTLKLGSTSKQVDANGQIAFTANEVRDCHNHDNRYLLRTTDTFVGELHLQDPYGNCIWMRGDRSTKNSKASILFRDKHSKTWEVMRLDSDNTTTDRNNVYGCNLIISTGGSTVIHGGDDGYNGYERNLYKWRATGDTDDKLVLSADDIIHLYTNLQNCNTDNIAYYFLHKIKQNFGRIHTDSIMCSEYYINTSGNTLYSKKGYNAVQVAPVYCLSSTAPMNNIAICHAY